MDDAKSRTVLVSAVGFAVIAAAASILYSARGPHAARGPVAPRAKIRIGLPGELLATLCHIAAEKGFLAEEGIDVEATVTYPSGKLALLGMLADEVDVASTAEVPIVFNSFTLKEFQVLATIGSSSNDPRVIARRDRGIEKPEDLKGKRLATQRASAVHFFLHLFMLKHALTESDVELSFMKGKELPEALASGKIDAFSMREPFISQARELSGAENTVQFAEPGLYLKTFNLVAGSRFVQGNPDVVKGILRALVKAEDFAQANREETIRLTSRRLKISRPEIEAVWPETSLRVSLDQALLSGLEDEAEWALKNGLVEGTGPPNYLDFIHLDGLLVVRPESVSIIR